MLAGVGVGTVSRVLNDAAAVRPETRARVQRAIAELDYHPNHAARQLVTARTLTLGVVLPFLTRPFFVNVLQGIEGAVASTDYHLNIFNVETMDVRTYYFGELPYRGRIDGLIVVSLPLSTSEVDRLTAAKIPTVMIDGLHPRLPSVSMHNFQGAYQAVEFLIGKGHQHIAFISGPVDTELGFTVNRERLEGYTKALEDHGLSLNVNFQQTGTDSHAGGAEMAHRLLDMPSPPTAIFTSSDVHALGAMQAATARGLRVPEDVAIVGYDDIELAAYVGLTTMRQPMADMGRRGVALLLDLIAGNSDRDAPPQERLSASLILRQTA